MICDCENGNESGNGEWGKRVGLDCGLCIFIKIFENFQKILKIKIF